MKIESESMEKIALHRIWKNRIKIESFIAISIDWTIICSFIGAF